MALLLFSSARVEGGRELSSAELMREWFGGLRDWLRALLGETRLAVFTALSAASTLLTFFPILGLGRLRLIFLISLLLSFGWSNFRVYRRQRAKIGELQTRLTEGASLVIHSGDRTRYILEADRANRARVLGIYIELDMMIENRGSRNSIIHQYSLTIDETGKQYSGLQPDLRRQLIQGKGAQYGLNPALWLTKDGVIDVPACGRAGPGLLPFYLKDTPGVRCSLIHCVLTVTDTNGMQASYTFAVGEQQ